MRLEFPGSVGPGTPIRGFDRVGFTPEVKSISRRTVGGGAMVEARLRLRQRSGQSVCRAAVDRRGDLSAARAAAAGLPRGCGRSGAVGNRPAIAAAGRPGGLNADRL